MRFFSTIGSIFLLASLGACQLDPMVPEPVEKVQTQAPTQQSANSLATRAYFQRVQSNLLVHGLLRIDGGGADTPVTPAMLARNFEQLTFYDEHRLGPRLTRSTGQQRLLSRWDQPVRMAHEFGPSVTQEIRNQDQAIVARYADRLAQITGHAISTGHAKPNFHILVIGEDDRDVMLPRLRRLLPGVSNANLVQLVMLPKDVYCLQIVRHAQGDIPRILSAVTIIRAENPDLLRRSCYHEELAQGLGLVNDSPFARPSIFNDDDEFALLTRHDEALLAMLYDKRLKIGMSADEARPIVNLLAQEYLGEDV